MPVNVVKSKADEKKWGKAKQLASEEGHTKDWAYIMSIYKGLKGNRKMNKTAYLIGYRDTGMLKTAFQSTPGMVGRAGVKAIRNTRNSDEAPVMSDSSQLWRKALGDGTVSNIADFGTYLVPVVGDARMGYDAISDYANMFGDDMDWKRRLMYGLSGTTNAAFAGLGLAGTAMGGAGSSVVTAVGRPLAMWLSKYKKGAELVSKLRHLQRVGKLAQNGKHVLAKGTKFQKPANFLFGKNPYAKGVKRYAYGAGRFVAPLAVQAPNAIYDLTRDNNGYPPRQASAGVS